jgi:hypothetical protein
MSVEFISTAVLRATVLLALGLAALNWLPRSKPQWRRVAGLLALGTSLVAPFMPVISAGPLMGETWRQLPYAGGVSGHIWLLCQVLAVLWLAGVILASIRLARKSAAMRRWINHCIPFSSVQDHNHPEAHIAVRVGADATAPCVAGWLRPVLIVPECARDWDKDTWRCVLAHELQHIRQGDLWLGWIAHLARVVYWWHPLVWRLIQHMGLESEACCDDAVLRVGVRAGDYARVLLRFTGTGQLGTASGYFIHGRTPSNLRMRIERLLADSARPPSRWTIVAVSALLLAGVGGCFWLGFEKAELVRHTELKEESQIRWNANPFPGDDH